MRPTARFGPPLDKEHQEQKYERDGDTDQRRHPDGADKAEYRAGRCEAHPGYDQDACEDQADRHLPHESNVNFFIKRFFIVYFDVVFGISFAHRFIVTRPFPWEKLRRGPALTSAWRESGDMPARDCR